MNGVGGRAWFATQTARTLVQMTGRGVRGAEDHAVTVILDSQFMRWYSEWKHLLPRWWVDGLETKIVRNW